MPNSVNYVCVDSLKEYGILIAAPGATVKNTKIHRDRGPADGKGSVFVKVGKPDIEEEFADRVDFGFRLSFGIPDQYDIGTVRARVKNGLITIKVAASKERIAEVSLDKE